MNPAPFDENYWNSRYKDEKTGWDIGAASPPLVAYFDQLADRNISILIHLQLMI
jgi:thiopurine S-methyltransferase